MWRFLITLLFLPLECLVSASCPSIDPANITGPSGELIQYPSCLNLSGQSLETVSFNVVNQMIELDLSYNKIQSLREDFLKSAISLRSLFLHNNKLKSLSSLFFVNTHKLKLLRLERNPLVSIPAENFSECLETLSVDCTCDMTRSILQYCNRCTLSGIKCQCFSSEAPMNATGYSMNATSYYSSNCRYSQRANPSLYLAIVLPVLILILLPILAYFLIWRKRGATMNHEKQASKTLEGTSGQPRYISHLSPPGSAFQDTGCHDDYENIYHNQNEGEVSSYNRKPPKKRSPSKGESTDVSQMDQPIYANDQGVYYNYPGKPLQDPVNEEIYIIPDQ